MNVPASYFHTMYARSPDPSSPATRWYDQRKYNLTVAALPRARDSVQIVTPNAIGSAAARNADSPEQR